MDEVDLVGSREAEDTRQRDRGQSIKNVYKRA